MVSEVLQDAFAVLVATRCESGLIDGVGYAFDESAEGVAICTIGDSHGRGLPPSPRKLNTQPAFFDSRLSFP